MSESPKQIWISEYSFAPYWATKGNNDIKGFHNASICFSSSVERIAAFKTRKYISESHVNELLEAKNAEIAKLKAKIDTLLSDPNKQPPSLQEFMAYAKTLQPYKPELNFALESKYEAWKDNKWKDGFNKPIKNWKSKLKNTIIHLKPVYNNSKPNDTIYPNLDNIPQD